MIGRTNTGGGAGLNIKIVGGTTEPSSPSENLIWVNTDVQIEKFVISYNEPQNPASGLIWIKPADNGNNTLNLSRRGTVAIRVGTVGQYVTDAWIGKDAKVYVNNSWVPIQEWAYDDGTKYCEFSPVTLNGVFSDESETNGWLRLSDNTQATGYKHAVLYTSEKVETKDLHAMHASITATNSNGYFDLSVRSDKTSSASGASDPNAITYMRVDVAGTQGATHEYITNERMEWTLDLSGVTEDAYASIHTGSKTQGGASSRIRVHEIWFT